MLASLLFGLVVSSAIKKEVRSFDSRRKGFKIILACDKEGHRCDEIEDSIRAATGFFENALVLSKQIVVDATYLKESDEGLWDDGNSLGLGSPELITKIEGNMTYQTPRALFKQVTRRKLNDGPDIILHIISNVEMFVPDGET
ncbi:hypothetical protein DSO57_1005653 [Entomophthora muscae]|uniref:Uncharacterized protein n=1 Tax=Entomophthora muscae TaxID=34485 RepID=A0ACC2RYX1_9FUNG|nr:hypothetical protein DSO57_1005653 [Entomophthora muscae]